MGSRLHAFFRFVRTAQGAPGVLRPTFCVVVALALVASSGLAPLADAQPPVRVISNTIEPMTSRTATTPAPDATPVMVEVEDGHTGEVVRIPASELELPASAATDSTVPDGYAAPNQPPAAWLEGPTRCSSYKRRRFCDGPLRVPEPFGPEAELAHTLGLGTHTAGGRALNSAPSTAWLAEAAHDPPSDRIGWPVDGGRFVRALKRERRVRVVTRTRSGARRVRYRTIPGHNGVDIAAAPGTHALAVDAGLVVYSKNEMRGYGNVVVVLHASGAISLYAHLRAAWVFAGQHVRRGQIVGEIGETGLARGPHLHFEWRHDGVPLDPRPFFDEWPRPSDNEAVASDGESSGDDAVGGPEGDGDPTDEEDIGLDGL